MRKIIAINHVSLDGIMQSPGHAQEDPRDGFTLGGWIVPYWTAEMGAALTDSVAGRIDLLLGRRSYEMLAAYWPHADPNPITEAFNRATKYVATRGALPLDWVNTEVLRGDAISAIRALKTGDGPEIQLYGSSSLLHQMASAGLVDEYVIRTYPLILGRGKRLFADGTPPRALQLLDSETSTTGVTACRYRVEGAVRPGDFGQVPSDAERARRARLAAEAR
ncbi:dihydrofolate reductase family protein [Paracoccus sp. S1E-3]|uniref:dihydrofolate reductase family protein n=1 Tax=Paracoccus sp. S1E-3 TaxID=2756130 RepID=UPI0015EEE31D|nr:dihydrofolate reductase family protein [Paracoccus sp. S1E-3]MBA4491327.1 dihydrofolate reductase family protein [Paracoccus sp. S1E-3]